MSGVRALVEGVLGGQMEPGATGPLMASGEIPEEGRDQADRIWGPLLSLPLAG